MGQAKRIEIIAAACHEVHRVCCESMGDQTQVGWASATKDRKLDVCYSVKLALQGITPAQAHGTWVLQMKSSGWKHGDTMDKEKKIHPALVPYDDLPDFIKIKDTLFCRTVAEMSKVVR